MRKVTPTAQQIINKAKGDYEMNINEAAKIVKIHYGENSLLKANVYIKKVDECIYEVLGQAIDFYDGAMHAESKKEAREVMIFKVANTIEKWEIK